MASVKRVMSQVDPIVVELDNIAAELEKTGNVDLAKMVDECSEELLNPVEPKKAAVRGKARKQKKASKKAPSLRRKIVRASANELKSIAHDIINDGGPQSLKEARAVLKMAEELEDELKGEEPMMDDVLSPEDEEKEEGEEETLEDGDEDLETDEDLEDAEEPLEGEEEENPEDDGDDIEAALRMYAEEEPEPEVVDDMTGDKDLEDLFADDAEEEDKEEAPAEDDEEEAVEGDEAEAADEEGLDDLDALEKELEACTAAAKNTKKAAKVSSKKAVKRAIGRKAATATAKRKARLRK